MVANVPNYRTFIAESKELVRSSRGMITISRFRLDATLQLIESYKKPSKPDHVCHGDYQVHIVQNPSANLERLNGELWMYAANPGDHQFTGWFMYFECGEGEVSQLWGPFEERQYAELYAGAYYWTLPQRLQRCGSVQ